MYVEYFLCAQFVNHFIVKKSLQKSICLGSILCRRRSTQVWFCAVTVQLVRQHIPSEFTFWLQARPLKLRDPYSKHSMKTLMIMIVVIIRLPTTKLARISHVMTLPTSQNYFDYQLPTWT